MGKIGEEIHDIFCYIKHFSKNIYKKTNKYIKLIC